jgi:ACS family tartrate transporter-like MFS transporter
MDPHQPVNDVATSVAAKLQRRVLPVLVLAWFIAYIDRFNVSYAALQMNQQLGLTATVFGFGAGVFFVGYSLFEIPSNLFLLRVGPRRWLSRIMVTWGLVTMGMVFIDGVKSFYTLRFLLGVAEAGCFPGMAFYLSQWLTPRQRAQALGVLGSAAMMSGIFGGPLAAGLLALDGAWGLAGWQWLFLCEGLPAVIVGFLLLKLVPDQPQKVSWLTPEERSWVSARMPERAGHAMTRASITAVMSDRRYLVWAAAFLCASACGSATIVFRPIIMQQVTNLSDTWAALVSALPNVVGVIAIVYVGRHATLVDERRWHAAVPMIISAIGVALVGVTYGLIGAMMVAALSSFGGAAQPPLFASVSGAGGESPNAVAIAFVNSAGALGGFIGPYLVGYVIDTAGLALACAVAAAFMFVGAGLVLSVRTRRPSPITAPVPLSAS